MNHNITINGTSDYSSFHISLDNIVGNVKLPHSEVQLFWDFLVQFNAPFILSLEKGKSGTNEHIHFALEKCLVKPESIKQYIRKEFPQLKKSIQGGEKRYNCKQLKKPYQIYYLFKEEKLDIRTYKCTVDIQEYTTEYKSQNELIKTTSSNKFFLYCKGQATDVSNLIRLYLSFSLANDKAVINKFDCEKHINYVLLRSNSELLYNKFLNYLEPPELFSNRY